MTDDVAGARAQAAKEFAMYGHLPSYRAMLDREGYTNPEDAAIIGDEKTVSDRLDELSAAGVDEFAGSRLRRLSRGARPHPRPAANQGLLTAEIPPGVTAVTGVRSTARRVRE